MTRNILPTDIELASRLVAADRPAENVIAALVSRGVDSASAAQLADDLRHGRKVAPEIPPTLEIAPRRRRPPKGTPPQSPPLPPSPPPEAQPRRKRRTRPGAEKPKLSVVHWLLGAAAVGAVVFAAGLLIADAYRHGGGDSQPGQPEAVVAAREQVHSPESSQTSPAASSPAGTLAAAGQTADRKPSSGGPQSLAAAVNDKFSPAQLVLELKPDGLRIRGKLIPPGNVLASVSEILGSPRRTTQAGQSDTGVYAFDSQGVLVYSGHGAGKDSIVLDCEGNGGANGTAAPFAGLLRVEDQVIRPDTDSRTLAGLEQLGLTNPGTGGGIFSGRYHSFELAFAYLRNSQRLSLIEIDLK